MKRLVPAALSLCMSVALTAAGAAVGAGPAGALELPLITPVAKAPNPQLIPGDIFGPILAQGTGSPIDGSSSFVSGSSQRANNAVQDGWKRAYGSLPPQVQQAVPPQLRPAEAPLPPEVTVVPAHEPSPAPEPPKCFNCVAITYDDGPVPGTTEQLLDTLKRKNVHATFFMVGQNADAYPQLVRRVRDEGHTIGNHSYSHPDLAHQADGAIAAQFDDTSAALERAAGVHPVWARPPYGSYDGRVAAAVGARGMSLAVWSVDTADWQHRNTATTCSRAVEGAHEGSIILMHDIHQPTVDAAECVIDGLRAKGLRPVSLEEMFRHPEPGHVYDRDE